MKIFNVNWNNPNNYVGSLKGCSHYSHTNLLKLGRLIIDTEIEFENDNSDLSYLFLSSDESIEAIPYYWEKDGGIWAISFQPTNDFDLEHLVNQ